MATILVVDDDPSIRTLLTFALGDLGDVLVSADAWTACELVKQRRPDIALVDVMMPGRTGLELVRAWRRDPAVHPLPVLVMTARDLQDDEAAAYEAGANGYLTKPFNLDVMVDLVRAHLPVEPRRLVRTGATRARGRAAERVLAGHADTATAEPRTIYLV